jgi:site-specific DNA-methyltransferase (adenine-specific)
MIVPFYKSTCRDFTLLHGDCFELLPQFEFKFDMIFADPPYFLSNDGISYQAGKIVSVNKGDWDKGGTTERIREFNHKWIALCREKLKDNGTIWVSGTYHNIFAVANSLSDLGFKILNVVTWNKTDPPDNVSHRVFKHSAEYIIWAKKSRRAQHRYNYELMRQLNDGKQMTDVWRMPAVAKWEKSCGKHPTQKPLSLLARIIMASTKEGDWVLDPFNGSGTTGVAASLLGRKFLGIDMEESYLELASKRRKELENEDVRQAYKEMVLVDFNGAIQA